VPCCKASSTQPYKHGFVTRIESDVAAKGLNEDTIRLISTKKREPEWRRTKQMCHQHRGPAECLRRVHPIASSSPDTRALHARISSTAPDKIENDMTKMRSARELTRW